MSAASELFSNHTCSLLILLFKNSQWLHFKEILIHVFPEKELRGLSPNFHIHVSVNDLYIITIGPPIFLQQNMQTDGDNA